MPFCEVRHNEGRAEGREETGSSLLRSKSESEIAGTRLFYRLLGRGDIKILLIMGLAGTHEAWRTQLMDLAGTVVPNEDEPEHPWPFCDAPAAEKTVDPNGDEAEEDTQNGGNLKQDGAGGCGRQVCIYDNRGVGKSSIPRRKSAYSTTIMAMDALSLLDHLGWEKAHVFGHSMGGMIACKLGAMAPERVASLAFISVTGGGWECIPKLDKTMLSISYRFLRAKTPEDRASVDLDTHYTMDYLETTVDGERRRSVLHKEYVKSFSMTGMQPKHGLDGHSSACWNHRVTEEDVAKISRSGILVSVIHGRSDLVAAIDRAARLAKRLSPVARMVTLEGAHFVLRESAKEVNGALLDLIRASEAGVQPAVWSNLSTPGSAVEDDNSGTDASAQALPSTYMRWIYKTFFSAHTVASSYLWYWLSPVRLLFERCADRNQRVQPSDDEQMLLAAELGEKLPGRKGGKKRKPTRHRRWKPSCLQPPATNA